MPFLTLSFKNQIALTHENTTQVKAIFRGYALFLGETLPTFFAFSVFHTKIPLIYYEF
jgi:hypothetical protein